jgi:hypothetical protein
MSPSISNRLDVLFSQIAESKIDGTIAIAELRSLLNSITNPYQREKIEEALIWANMYFRGKGPKRLTRWGGEDVVRGHLLGSIYKAISARKPAHDLN